MSVLHASICLSDLLELAKRKKKLSSFTRGKNGKAYVALTVWINEKADKYGKDVAITLNPAKGVTEEKIYIGSGKTPGNNSKQINHAGSDSKYMHDDDLPF